VHPVLLPRSPGSATGENFRNGTGQNFRNSQLFRALDPIGVALEESFHRRHGFSTGIRDGRYEWDLQSSDPAPDSEKARMLGVLVTRLKQHTRRVYEALRARIGSRASLVSLLDRFKQRCEWHDAERLRDLCQAPTSKGRVEEVLTRELARWLFDEGLSPISTPMLAGRRPDLLDSSAPAKLYVEAKQYSKSAKKYLLKGFRQAWDAVEKLHATPYSLDEAFLIIFRLAGPLYVLPETVIRPGWTMHLRVIDISPASEHGSKNAPKPVVISESELFKQSPSGS
jgi:hypothetical protein